MSRTANVRLTPSEAFQDSEALAGPIVRFEGVGLRYGRAPEVLRDLSFELDAGSFHFLTGASGAGKTSLLRLIDLALRPSRGLISLFGHDTALLKREDLPFVRRRRRCRQGAIPEALRQASVRRSSGLSTSLPLPRGHASSRNHALVDGTFRVSVREPEREIVRWGPGRAWRGFPFSPTGA